MSWKFRVARLAGIDVFLHWTFLLLVAWFAFSYALGAGEDATTAQRLQMAAAGVGFIAAVFTCIVLHELGHALAARQYGIQTRDITLLPIGGLARLERMPEKPWEELWVAAAGPLVNVVIAGVLILVLSTNIFPLPWDEIQNRAANINPGYSPGVFLFSLLAVNVFLVLFNLIPAFPMDGGRMLRALLATRMEYSEATRTAANVGQLLAIGFAIWGMMSGAFLLIFIALFVYLGAEAEAGHAETTSAIRHFRVRDAMMTDYKTLDQSDTLDEAARELLAGTQRDFPVIANGQPIGILDRATLFAALREADASVPVASVLNPLCPMAEADLPLNAALTRMRENGCSTLAVIDHGQIVGLLSLENVGELIALEAARHHRKTPPTARQMMAS